MTFFFIFFAFFILLFIGSLYVIFALKRVRLKTSIKKDHESGSRDDVISTLLKLLRKNPENIQTRLQLVKLYMDVENYTEAIFHINSIITHAKDHPDYNDKQMNFLLADCYDRMGNLDEASRVYSLMVAAYPDDVYPYLQKGKIELKKKNIDRAINQFEKVLSIDPRNASAMKELGKILFTQKKFREAAAHLQNAFNIDPDEAEINFYLGEIMYRFQKQGKAFQHYRKAKNDTRFAVRSMFIIAQLLRKAGKLGEARKILTNILKLPGLKRDHVITIEYELGEVCLAQNDIPAAVEQWQDIMSKTSGFKDVHEKLNKYEQMKTNYALRQYMMSGKSEFVELCKGIVNALTKNGSFIRADSQGNYSVELLVQAIYKNVPAMILFKFFRGTGTIGHLAVREFYEKVKELKVNRGICMTNTTFSEDAVSFSEGRVLELYDKEKLFPLVTKVL